MTDTANLGLPFIEGSQAQKHVTHNEALRILDAAIQIAVLDLTRTAPPSSPTDGERHVVASGATGAWAGQAYAIATWQDGAWAFVAPHIGWCIWSVADNVMFVFDGTHWRDLRDLPVTLDNAVHVGINTTASSPNLLSVKSNAAMLAAILAADGGSGDVRLQLSKESAAKTASVFFSNNFSGRAEFGLVGADAFKLKVSADGSSWVEAVTVDQTSGNLMLPRGLALSGVVAPSQITSNQNNYAPAGIASAAVLQISSDAARSVSGLAGGAEGRVVALINVGGQVITLLDENAGSSAANRFTLGGDLVLAAKQAAILRYDGTAARWQAIAASGLRAANNLSDLSNAATARGNLGLGSIATKNLSDAFALTDATASSSTATGALLVANGGIGCGGDVNWAGAASATYTPSAPTATAGSFSSVAGTMKWKRFGKYLLMQGTLSIAGIGSASGRALVPIPVAAVSGRYFPLQAILETGFASAVAAVGWDATSALSISLAGLGSGSVVHFNGIYEAP